MPKLRPPFQYFGGKFHLLNKLLPLVPKHKYYIEAFGGAGNLLINKEPSYMEVFNDINGDIANFFKVLVDEEKFERFYRKVSLSPYSREFWKWCKETYKECEDEVERAFRWWVVVEQSFGGQGRTWSFSVKKSKTSKYLSRIELLPKIHARLQRVVIENKHWKDLLDTYSGCDFNEEFIYLDPPYLPQTRKSGKYEYEMTYEDHEELIDYLLTHRRRVMLSGYDNELYQKLEKYGWKKICWEVYCHAVGRTRMAKTIGKGALQNHKRIECVWINYEPEK